MKRVSQSKIDAFQKTMLKGAVSASAPGLAAVVAAFTVPVSILQHYIGLGSVGTAALGVIFFWMAYLFYNGYYWAGIPSLFCSGWALWTCTAKAGRLLLLYFQHNPVTGFSDIITPLSFISLQITLLIIASTLGYVIFKAFRLCRNLSPQPINRFVWGAMGLWILVVVLDSMDRFQL